MFLTIRNTTMLEHILDYPLFKISVSSYYYDLLVDINRYGYFRLTLRSTVPRCICPVFDWSTQNGSLRPMQINWTFQRD